MTTPSRLSSSNAVKRFDALCKKLIDVSAPDAMLQGWNVFKQFCDVPVERNLEGAQFEFKQAKFELPHGRFYFGFRRYWYKPGRVSDTAYLATIDCRFAFHPELRKWRC